MNLRNYYYYFTGVLSNKFCDEIINHAKRHKTQIAKTDEINKDNLSKKELTRLRKIRHSDVVWLDDQWIYKEIHPYVHEANKAANWNFDWDWSETCQFTEYKKNQFYNWHADSNIESYNNPNNLNFHNKIRKLSVTCSLTDPINYKGGELQFYFNNSSDPKKGKIVSCLEILPRGSIVVFPSFVSHRVMPVKKGIRHSLVMWNIGYPFK